jgi:DNA primase
MIPIRDLRGRVIGFGARVIGHGEPKYLNSPQSPVFDKGRTLFGMDMARRAIREEDRAFVVEGYMDVISAFQRGVRNIVASMGTALTEHHLRQLKRLTRNIYLALDPDSAGINATLRGLDVARSAMEKREVPVVFPGMIRFEHALDVALYVLPLPEGKDPDDIFRERPELWKEVIRNAQPLVEFAIEMRLKDLDLSTAKGKAEAVRRAVPILKDVANSVERSHYIQELSRRLALDPRLLEREFWEGAWQRPLHRQRRYREQQVQAVDGSWIVSPGSVLERYILSLLLQDPERLRLLDEALKEALHEPLSPADFGEEPHRLLFESLKGKPLPDALESLKAEMLAEIEHRPPPRPDQVEKVLMESALRLRIHRTREEIGHFQELLSEAEDRENREAIERYGEEIQRLLQTLGFLQNSLSGYNVVTPETKVI